MQQPRRPLFQEITIDTNSTFSVKKNSKRAFLTPKIVELKTCPFAHVRNGKAEIILASFQSQSVREVDFWNSKLFELEKYKCFHEKMSALMEFPAFPTP